VLVILYCANSKNYGEITKTEFTNLLSKLNIKNSDHWSNTYFIRKLKKLVLNIYVKLLKIKPNLKISLDLFLNIIY